jgi:hypothetical protein
MKRTEAVRERTTAVTCGVCGSTVGVAYINAGDVYFGALRKIDKRTMGRRGLKSRWQARTPTKRGHSFDVFCFSCRKWITISLKRLRARLVGAGVNDLSDPGEGPGFDDGDGPKTVLVWAQNGGTFTLDPRFEYCTSS